MKVNWISCKERLPETAGDYLVAFPGDSDFNLDADVARFYLKGDVLTCGEPEVEGSAEERLLDSLLNHEVKAEKNGFYHVGLDYPEYWELMPLFWAELPEAPDGYEYRTV